MTFLIHPLGSQDWQKLRTYNLVHLFIMKSCQAKWKINLIPLNVHEISGKTHISHKLRTMGTNFLFGSTTLHLLNLYKTTSVYPRRTCDLLSMDHIHNGISLPKVNIYILSLLFCKISCQTGEEKKVMAHLSK